SGRTGAATAATMNARPPMTCDRFAMSYLSWLRAHEQPMRPHNENGCHDAVNHEKLDLRHEMHCRRTAYSDDQRADQRAFDRPHAADGDHGESQHDDLDADTERDRDLRRHHRAAE